MLHKFQVVSVKWHITLKHWRRMGIYGTSLNDSTKVKLINKGSITFVSPFFANAMLCAVLIINYGMDWSNNR